MAKTKVTFHGEDGGMRSITLLFKSTVELTKFVEHYENAGGFKQFSWDLWDDTYSKDDYPLVNNSYGTFMLILCMLYPKIYNTVNNDYLKGKAI